MSTPGHVWVTRAEPGASVTGARLRVMGFEPLIAPLLAVRRLETPVDMTDVAALAFTSANGVAAFAARSARRDLPVFAVGDATADAARAAGFAEVRSAAGDVAALTRMLKAERPAGVVLHPTAAQPAGDLASDLTRAGITARSIPVYETVAAPDLPIEVDAALKRGEITAVLIHSSRAAEALRRLVTPADLSGLLVVGLSPACLAPLAGLSLATATATMPHEDALLAALGNALARR